MRFWNNKLYWYALAILIGFLAACHFAGYRINVTDSLPVGIYRLVSEAPKRGDLVSFSLPEENPYASISHSRNYLGRSSRPFLKRLVAIPGDDIGMNEKGILVNGHRVANSAYESLDSKGRPLPRYLITGTVPQRKALALSDYNPRSLDGRYFGLVDLNDLQKVIPVLTLN